MAVVIEGRVANGRLSVKLDAVQILTFAESVLADGRQRGGQLQRQQSRLVVGIVAQHGDTLGDDGLADIVAAEEGVGADGLQRGGQGYGAQAPVLIETAAPDALQLGGQAQPRQIAVARQPVGGQFGHESVLQVQLHETGQPLAQGCQVVVTQRTADAQALDIGKILYLLQQQVTEGAHRLYLYIIIGIGHALL